MGKDYQKKAEKKNNDAKGPKPRQPGGIPKYQHFPKASLAPYPDEEGNALWLGDNENLQELLTPSNILASRSPKNSEMLARPGMAVTLSAAAIHLGAKELMERKGAKAFEKVKDSAADEVRWVGYFSDGGRVPSMNLTILGQDWHHDDDDDDGGGGGDDDDDGE